MNIYKLRVLDYLHRTDIIKESETYPTNAQILTWSTIILLMILISISNYDAYQVGTHYDDSTYVVLARSFVHSSTYGLINVPGNPEVAKYPFGYPLLLAPVTYLFPDSLVALKVPSLIFTLLNASIIFWGWKILFPKKSYWWGIGISGLYALAPMTIDHTRRVMSEPTFTFFCLISILLVESYVQGKQPRGWTTMLGIASVFMAYTRSVGVILVIVIFIYLLIKKGLKQIKVIAQVFSQMVILLGMIIILTPVQIRDLVPLEYFRDENARFFVNIVNVSEDNLKPQLVTDDPQPALNSSKETKASDFMGVFLFGIKEHLGKDLRVVALPLGGGLREAALVQSLGYPSFSTIFGYLVSFLVIFGFYSILRHNDYSFLMLFAIIYFLIIFFWIWNDPRLLYPIQPQIQIGFIAGITGIIFWVIKPIKKTKAYSVILSSTSSVLIVTLILIASVKSCLIDDTRNHVGDIALRTEWINAHTLPGDILLTEAPVTDYIYSGRKTLILPVVSTANQLTDFLKQNRIDYILVAPQIIWQSSYKPYYSETMEKFLPLLELLNSENKIHLAYYSNDNMIKVYAVQK